MTACERVHTMDTKLHCWYEVKPTPPNRGTSSGRCGYVGEHRVLNALLFRPYADGRSPLSLAGGRRLKVVARAFRQTLSELRPLFRDACCDQGSFFSRKYS